MLGTSCIIITSLTGYLSHLNLLSISCKLHDIVNFYYITIIDLKDVSSTFTNNCQGYSKKKS